MFWGSGPCWTNPGPFQKDLAEHDIFWFVKVMLDHCSVKNSISYGSWGHSDTGKRLVNGLSSLDLRANKCHLGKYGWVFFPQIFWKRGLFPKYLEKIPLAPPPAAPSGRGGRIFSNIWKADAFFSKYLEKRPIHIFLIATARFFQITIIYKGTQVTTIRGWGKDWI